MKYRKIVGWVIKFSYLRFEFKEYFEATEFARKMIESYAGDAKDKDATLIPIYADGEEFEQKVAMTFKEMLDEDPDELVEVQA